MPAIHWRRVVRTRWFHAAWIGAAVLALMIWFDVVVIGVMVVFLLASAVLFIEWIISIWTPESRRRRRFKL